MKVYIMLDSSRCLSTFLAFLSLQLTGILQFVVRLSTEVEAKFTSVERLLEYITVRDLNIKLTSVYHAFIFSLEDSFHFLSLRACVL